MQSLGLKIDNTDKVWIIATAALAISGFVLALSSQIESVSYIAAGILTISIIITAFRMPYNSPAFIIPVSMLYLIITVFPEPTIPRFVNFGVYTLMMLLVGIIISLLSMSRSENEERYRSIFQTSPAPMLITDANGIITDANESFTTNFGYPPADIIGKKICQMDFIHHDSLPVVRNIIFPDIPSASNPVINGETGRPDINTENNEEEFDSGFDEIRIIDSNGRKHPCKLTSNIIHSRSKSKQVIMRIIGLQDMTDTVLAQRNMVLSLREKDVLLREVHHRVKNNLQIIVSLLKLQKNRTDDEKTRDILSDCQNRVYSMAIVHEKMYRSDNLSSIDIRDYLESLAKSIMMEYTDRIGRVDISVTSDFKENFDLELIVPCALITNELLTNSFKYAFPEKSSGNITIDLKRNGDGYIYTYSDSGKGVSQEDLENSTSLGMKIIKILVHQIHGEMEIGTSTTGGFKFVLGFKRVIP